ncbi:hypothetical protein [Okeania sp. SIO2B3]|uniref:hypothetical protein n=1 Tax=Okeania sp. SIO2B3 TaxID=2607784 RepID=UPI0013C097DE|nr:hypothetical protein [Okeania sp. SIO2B3]NET46711.1 hypothetical protein [Okeania sp. SIO2B3]
MEVPEKIINAGIALGDNYTDIVLKIASQRLNQRINVDNSFVHDVEIPYVDVESIEVFSPPSLPSPPSLRQLPSGKTVEDSKQLDDNFIS